MNPVTIIAELLQSIPPKVRKVLYAVFAALVIAEFVAEEILGYDTGKSDEVLLYVGGLLGIQAAANVQPKEETVLRPDDYHDDEDDADFTGLPTDEFHGGTGDSGPVR